MKIRFAQLEDARSIAELRVATWRSTYAGLMPAAYLASLSVDQSEAAMIKTLRGDFPQTFVLVCTDEAGRILGFACAGQQKDETHPEYDGEIYALYVLQSCQGCGIGRRLVNAAAAELLKRGYHNLIIWVLKGNPAAGFYSRMGGTAVREKLLDIDGLFLPEVGFGWPQLQQMIV